MQGINRLSDNTIKKTKPSGGVQKLCDGDKLYLFIQPTGKKIWRVLWREKGKDKQFTIGEYPAVSLKTAREERTRVKGLLAQGLDPNDEKKWKNEQAEHETTVQARTFEAVAREWHERRTTGQSNNTRQVKMQRLAKHVFSQIGNKPISELSRPDFVKVLLAIEQTGTSDMPRRVAGIIDEVCRYAADVGYTKNYISYGLTRSLSRRAVKGHRSAITDPEEVRHLLLDIDNYGGDITTCYALRLMPYVFVRSNELRGALWKEFDFEKHIWTSPASRMKMRKEHVVPLSRQVEKLLRELHRFTGEGELLFPSCMSNTRCLTDVGLLNALRRMGYSKDKMCIHGFRAMASTLLNELGYRPDVIEAQLAHEEKNAIRAAYNRARYMPERITMMQEWADWLDTLKSQQDSTFSRKKLSLTLPKGTAMQTPHETNPRRPRTA